LSQYREATSRGEGKYQPSDARVISLALVPGEPFFPKKIPIVSAAFAGSLLLLSLLTMLRELFSGRALKPVNRFMGEDERVPSAVMPEPANTVQSEPEAERRETSLMSLAPEEPAEPPVDPEHTIKAMCDRLIDKGASRAVIVSPEGDEAAASSVLIAREMADRGLRSILLDLTQTGAASHPMVDGLALPGITNLLASQAQFADIIQNDPYSNAHVIPNGTADAQTAMKAVERLPIILNALTTAYDVVIVECGPADAKGIGRLVTRGAEIIISVIDPTDASIVKCAASLQDAGYEDLLIVTPIGSAPPAPQPTRRVA
jgi:Mrp family chromosome partitioning ATPase